MRAPAHAADAEERVRLALDVSARLWRNSVGIEIFHPDGRLILASGDAAPRPPASIWFHGGLIEAASHCFNEGGGGLLAFVLHTRLLRSLKLDLAEMDLWRDRARATTLLMDKNAAMEALQGQEVPCARTWTVNDIVETARLFEVLPADGRFVFKPAGGAAGIGVFGPSRGGVSRPELITYLESLRAAGKLPARYQVQDFIPGPPLGLTGWIGGDGDFEVFEIHEQFIDDQGRFAGGCWTPESEDKAREWAESVYARLSRIPSPRFRGLIGLDAIAGRVIEVNPRLTASAPVAHLLELEAAIAERLGSAFCIDRITLNTAAKIPYERMRDGSVEDAVRRLRAESGCVALPQGLNPFGHSRLIFVNDDAGKTAQRKFLRMVEG